MYLNICSPFLFCTVCQKSCENPITKFKMNVFVFCEGFAPQQKNSVMVQVSTISFVIYDILKIKLLVHMKTAGAYVLNAVKRILICY